MVFSDLETVLFPPVTGWLLVAKIFFILFNMGVLAFMIYVWTTTIYLRRLFIIDLVEFFTYRAYTSRLIDHDWIKIKKRLITKNEDELKLAIIEADLLVNDVMSRAAFAGANLAEKLENANPERFFDIDAAKEADGLYRKIVADKNIKLDYPTAKAAFLAFEQVLKDMAAFRDK
jgi:hypothetical protein